MGGTGFGCLALCETAVKAPGDRDPLAPLHGLVRDVYDGGFVQFRAVWVLVLPDDLGDLGVS